MSIDSHLDFTSSNGCPSSLTSVFTFNISLTSSSVILNVSAICFIVSSEISPVLRISA